MLNKFDKGYERLVHWKLQTVLREIKQDLNKREIYHVHELYVSILLRCQLYQNWSIQWLQSWPKFQQRFFSEIDKQIKKFTWKCQGPKIATTSLKKKNKVGRLNTISFQDFFWSYNNQDTMVLMYR